MTLPRRQFLQAAAALPLAANAQDAPPRRPPDLGSLHPDVQRLADDVRPEYSFLGKRFRDAETFTTTARDKLNDLLLYRPAAVPLKPEVLERTERDDHVREKVLYSTSANTRVPAYVLLPKKRAGKLPAIVDLHSHGGMFLFGKEKVIDLGDNHPAMVDYHRRNYDGRPTATELVRRGYVVLVSDAFAFGERRLLLDADRKYGMDRSKYSLADVKHLNQQCRGKESTLAKSMVWSGMTWPGIVAWDDQRSVDYLASRPEVDAERIGCLGISMGGYRACFLGGLDPRIKATCITGFMSTLRPMLRAHVDTHSWVHYLPGMVRWLDLPDVASLAVPRALMVQQCEKDGLFPIEGMRESVKHIEQVYGKAGVKERFAGRFYDEPHQFTKAMQEEAFAWLDRQLKG